MVQKSILYTPQKRVDNLIFIKVAESFKVS